eukprot:727711-Rhodomonas_salina.1
MARGMMIRNAVDMTYSTMVRKHHRRSVMVLRLTSLIRSVSRSRHSTTSPKSTTSCISGKRKILPQSRSVLPWGVFFDRRWRSNHPFQASLSWPMAMWKVVKGLGYQFRPAKRGGEWKHSLGSFKTAQVARDALETFIDNLPCKDLKMKLFRYEHHAVRT